MTGYINVVVVLVTLISLGLCSQGIKPWDYTSANLNDDIEQQQQHFLLREEEEINDDEIVTGEDNDAKYEEFGEDIGEAVEDEKDSVKSEVLNENGEDIPDTIAKSEELSEVDENAESKMDSAEIEEMSILQEKEKRQKYRRMLARAQHHRRAPSKRGWARPKSFYRRRIYSTLPRNYPRRSFPRRAYYLYRRRSFRRRAY